MCLRSVTLCQWLMVMMSILQVDHFSKYKLVADDDDGSETEGESGVKKPKIDEKVG